MESGNSGSVQSSTDEEYESQNDTISAFLSSSGNRHQPPMSMPPLRPPTSHYLPSASLFDSLSSYLDVSSPRSSPPINQPSDLDTMPWMRAHRPDQTNCTDLGGLMWSTQLPPIPAPSTDPYASGAANNAVSSSPSASTQQPTTPPLRGSKKRSRASRRAPTTIMTTETSNFRQMVQQFTGIPSPPFSSLAFAARSRLDLLHAATAAATWEPSSLLRQLTGKPPAVVIPATNNPLDPFAHLSSPLPTTAATTNIPFQVPSSIANHGATNIATAGATSTAVTSTSAQNPTLCASASGANPSSTGNYHLFGNQSTPQDPILAFQWLLQPSVQHQKPTMPAFGSKEPTSTSTAAMMQPIGTSWLPSTTNLVGSEGMMLLSKSSTDGRGDHRSYHPSAGWSDGSSREASGVNSQRVALNGVAKKGQLENVSSRPAGGNVDSSWHCPLD